jgi:hypothetical protein
MKTWQTFLQAFAHWPHPVSAQQAADKAGITGPQLVARLALLCVKNRGIVEGPPGVYRLTEAGCQYLREMHPEDSPLCISGVVSDPPPDDLVQQALRVSPVSIFMMR